MSKQLAPVIWRPLVFDEKHCDNSCPLLEYCFCRLKAGFNTNLHQPLKGEGMDDWEYRYIRCQACLDAQKAWEEKQEVK